MILLVQLRIYTTRDIWTFTKLYLFNGSWNFGTIFKYHSWCKSLITLTIIMITYTKDKTQK